ncbi:hypothetical protein HYT52_03195 [Candidatus Woesearchaeota archaeon]|nr:hypothetical protein [Candidatus Woesearchaeota archaeon]
MKEHKSKKEIDHWPYLAIVAIVAVVAVMFLVMQGKSSEELPDTVKVVDEEGNLVGEASRFGKSYKLSVGMRKDEILNNVVGTCKCQASYDACISRGGTQSSCGEIKRYCDPPC